MGVVKKIGNKNDTPIQNNLDDRQFILEELSK